MKVLPPRDHPHRDALFDLLLPVTVAKRDNKKRRAVLERHLRGDLGSSCVDLYLWLEQDQVESYVQTWAMEVACALVPRAHKLFARHRWLTGFDGSIDGLALVANTHNLLTRAIPIWLNSLKRKDSAQAPLPEPAGLPDPVDAQLIAFEADLQDLGAWSLNPDPAYGWCELNKAAKIDAQRFAESDPACSLLVLIIALSPLVALVDRMLHEGSAQWDKEQAFEAASGRPRKYRPLMAVLGNTTSNFYERMQDMMTRPERWVTLLPRYRTYEVRRLAFAFAARSLAGIHFLVTLPQSQYPFKLFLLLKLLDPTISDEEALRIATSIARDSDCLFDEFTRRFRAIFQTVADLRSMRCLTILLAIAIILRLCISRIECRHASVRRLLMVCQTKQGNHLDTFVSAVNKSDGLFRILPLQGPGPIYYHSRIIFQDFARQGGLDEV